MVKHDVKIDEMLDSQIINHRIKLKAASSSVFLASEDATYFTGQVLHPNGGLL